MYVISLHMLYSEHFYCDKHSYLCSTSRSKATRVFTSLYILCYWRQILRKFGIYKKMSVKQHGINMFHLPCIYQRQNIWKQQMHFNIYDVFYSQCIMYFIHNIWCILFTIYDVFYSQYMMYFIHNMWCISFTIHYVFYSQYIMYFIHNIWCILFTIYDVFHSQCTTYFIHNIYDVLNSKYMMYFVHNILCISFTILWIKYAINVAVYLLLCYIFWTTVLIIVMTCLAVPKLLVYTRKQTWKSHRCSFSYFLIEYSVKWDNGLPDQIDRCLWTWKTFCPPKQLTLCN
jgi:hypothetical protein